MFRKKAYNNTSDQLIHKEEKERLTHHFHRSLKCLQQKEHIDGATIYSNEASNNLCNVLEAVFLHGVKDNMVSKLVSYAQGIQGYRETEVKSNFWAVVKKFTHQDVIIQLQQLSQITSDIGLCRAWIRLAINDGLMASYLASMTADVKALRTFYQPWAYMLDYEQPEILRNHLTGLMSLHFNLSSNSSVLNKWSSTTLELASLIVENMAPPPVIRAETPTPPSSRRESVNSVNSMDSLGGSSITAANSSIAITTTAASLTAPSHTSHVYTITSTPPNTPAGSLQFPNANDLEALKRLAGQFRSSPASSGSSSAASSCPDPSEPQPSLPQHQDAVDGGGSHSLRSSRSNSPRVSRAGSRNSPVVFKTREEAQFEEGLKLKLLLDHLDRKQQKQMDEEDRKFQEGQERKRKEIIARVAREQVERKQREQREREEQLRLQKQAEEEWLRAKSQEPEKESHSHNDDDQQVDKSSTSPTDNLVEELKEAMISSDEPQQKEDSGEGRMEQPQEPDEPDIWAQRGSGFGNRLNARDGWTTASPLQNREQSYESMLRSYGTKQGNNRQMATVQDALDKLPSVPSTGSMTKDKQNEPFEAVDMSEEEIDFADYEIIHSASDDSDAGRIEQMKSLCKYWGKNQQQQTCATLSCDVGVGFFHGPGIPDEFDGKVYCDQCHLNQLAYIPAEIVFNWNFTKLKVSAENFKFLQRVQDRPLLEVDEMCPHVYNNIPALNSTMLLRTQLTSLRSYMFTCSESTARQLKDKVWPREHLYNKVHSYSVNDLLEVRSGKLEVFLKEVVDMCTKHVYSCGLCQAKGFYCELCRDGTPIFPFEIETTVKCKVCKNVYHTKCKRSAIPCPKCARWMERGMRRQNDDDDDYACSPN